MAGAPTPEPVYTTTTKPTAPTTIPTPRPQFPGPPLNVQARTLSDTEIEVTWSPPVDPHGKLVLYTVFYSIKVDNGTTTSASFAQ